MKGIGKYNPDWKKTSLGIKEAWGWCCERCGHPHDPKAGYSLTVHHLDGNKSNDAGWNLACLCQRCHLQIQGKVFLPQFYMFEHSDWFKPHVEGYYKAMADPSYTDDNMRDRYGSFYLLTGLEQKGHCFWCGAKISHGRRYCNGDHQHKYHEYFHWPDASSAALERANGHCQECDRQVNKLPDYLNLVIHHIKPLDGTLRNWNVLNQPFNLIALCHSCHGKEHARLAGTLRPKTPEDKCQAALDAGQIPMELQYSSENR